MISETPPAFSYEWFSCFEFVTVVLAEEYALLKFEKIPCVIFPPVLSNFVETPHQFLAHF